MNRKTKKKPTYSFENDNNLYINFLCQKIRFYQKEIEYLNQEKILWFQKKKRTKQYQKIKEYEDKIIDAYIIIGEYLS